MNARLVPVEVGGVLAVDAAGATVAGGAVVGVPPLGALAGPGSNLIYIWLGMRGHDLFALFVAIGVENVFSGFAAVCLR